MPKGQPPPTELDREKSSRLCSPSSRPIPIPTTPYSKSKVYSPCSDAGPSHAQALGPSSSADEVPARDHHYARLATAWGKAWDKACGRADPAGQTGGVTKPYADMHAMHTPYLAPPPIPLGAFPFRLSIFFPFTILTFSTSPLPLPPPVRGRRQWDSGCYCRYRRRELLCQDVCHS